MIIVDCEQGTPEWFAARSGKPTASGFSQLITTEGKPSKSRTKYMYKLAGERITGIPEETYQNAHMQRGTLLEDEARKFYELIKEVEVKKVGFCMSECQRYGCSPDGLVGEDGIIEIKCPIISTHVSYLLDNKLPIDYYQQVQGQLLITGKKWCDFISYYSRIKPLIIRVFPDPVFQDFLRQELNGFCGELEQVIRRLDNG